MDHAWIKTFVAVAHHRNFTRAAEDLYLSQPAASRQVQKLERELGVNLLDRSSTSIVLTPEGERFLEYAQQAIASYERIVGELRTSNQSVSGPLNIVASTIPGEFLVPDLVTRFTQIHPGVEPFITIVDSEGVVKELASKRWDLGFVGAKISGRGIQYNAVADDEVVLAVPSGFELANRGEIQLDELAQQAFIEREDGSGTLITVRRALARRGMTLPKYRKVMVLSSSDAVLSAVENGLGIGWVSSLALESRRPDRVVPVRISELDLRRTLYLAVKEQRELAPAASTFLRWLKKTR